MSAVLPTIMTMFNHEDSNSTGNDVGNGSGVKRKATEEIEEKDLKRKKNREAAKKCRDRKLQKTQDLQQKNEELEKENCQLVKQRNELMARCNALEEQIRQHKEQGCIMPQLSPLYELGDIFDPTISPSPLFPESISPSLSPCPSPASSVSPASVPTCSQQTYEADPVPGKHIYGDVGGLDDRGCEEGYPLANSRVNNSQAGSQATWTKTTEMPAPVTLATSQQTDHSPADEEPQLYVLHVRNKDGQRKELYLSLEDYVKVVTKIQARRTVLPIPQCVQSTSAVATYASAPQPQQMLSASQVKQKLPLELYTGAIQSLNQQSLAKVSVQNYKQSEKFDTDGDFESCFTDTIDDKPSHDFTLVNPNDVFKKELGDAGLGQMNFAQCETDSAVVKQKVADINCAMDSDSPSVFSQHQMSPGQQKGPGINVLADADDQSPLHVKTKNMSRLIKNEYPLDNTSLISTVCDPKTVQELEETTTLSTVAAKELTKFLTSQVVESIISAQSGQSVAYTNTSPSLSTVLTMKATADCIQCETVLPKTDVPPVLIKPAVNFPVDQNLSAIPDESLMKMVRLRPKATQLVTSIPKLPLQRTSQVSSLECETTSVTAPSSEEGMVVSATDNHMGLLKDAPTAIQSKIAGFKQASHGILQTVQNVGIQNDVMYLTAQQQKVPRVPVGPKLQYLQLTEKFQPSVSIQQQETTPALANPLSDSMHQIEEYMSLDDMDILDIL